MTIVGKEKTTEYQFGQKFNGTPFCPICGVSAFQNLYGPPQELIDRLPEARRAIVAKKLRIQPVNLRCLDGVEWDRISIEKDDCGTEGYEVPA